MQRLVAIFILSLFSINAYALTCNDVNGSYVYSPDGTYLGFFGNQLVLDLIDMDSLLFRLREISITAGSK